MEDAQPSMPSPDSLLLVRARVVSGAGGGPAPGNTFSTVAPRCAPTRIAHTGKKSHATIVPFRGACFVRAAWPGTTPTTVHRPAGRASITGAFAPSRRVGTVRLRIDGSTISTVLRTDPTWITCAPRVLKDPLACSIPS